MLLLNIEENMIVNKIIINKGFKTVQKMPKTESLYFAEKFLLTTSSSKKSSLSFKNLINTPIHIIIKIFVVYII